MGQAYYSRVGMDGVGLVRLQIKHKSTEPIDAVNISPLARFEHTTSTLPPRTRSAGI